MLNFSINTGMFPDSWKTAQVAPIFQNGDRDDRSNYRLISVLPVLSRLFQELVYDHLYNHLDKKTPKHISIWFSNPALGCDMRAMLSKLKYLLNRAARIVTNGPFDSSATTLIQDLGWPTIE